MKAEANKFKSQIKETKASLSIESKIDLGLNDILKDDLTNDSSKNETNEKIEKVSFKKEKLEKKEENA